MHSTGLIIKMKQGFQVENLPVIRTLLNSGQGGVKMERLYRNLAGDDRYALDEMKLGLDRAYLLGFQNRQNLIEAFVALKRSADLEYVEEDEINHAYQEPNDRYWGKLWGIRKILCLPAWYSSKGEQVIIAVIDTGIDLQHRDLIANLWQNQNGKYGYDFVNGDDNPDDDEGHGTHVAGIIAAELNNNIGVAGIAPRARLMALKGLDREGNGTTSTLANCIRYASGNGARIVNNSWGPGKGKTMKEIIDLAHSRNCIMTFAAGNSNSFVNLNSAAGNHKVISVAATDKTDSRLSTSNFGTTVAVSAPGLGIFSTLTNGRYGERSGTSAACPHVSGLIALLLGLKTGLNFDQVKEVVQRTADPVYTELDKPVGSGRINALSAIEFVKKNYGSDLGRAQLREVNLQQ